MQSRYYRTAIMAFLLVFLVGVALSHGLLFASSFPQLADALAAAAVIIDLGILLLIIYEDFGKPYFFRPKPVITDLILKQEHSPTERISVMGVPVTLFRSASTKLWMNVANDGKTPIKRMRARMRFQLLPKPKEAVGQRPEGITEEDWQQRIRLRAEFEAGVEKEIAESQFGRPLPFSDRTPKGTMGIPWIEADGRVSYEVDLSPNSDEASVQVIALYALESMALLDLEKAGVLKIGRPADQPLPNANVVVVMMGTNSWLLMNPRVQGLYQDLALKFWILSENMSKDVFEIFHVEISSTLDAISCTRLKKGSKQYKQFQTILSG